MNKDINQKLNLGIFLSYISVLVSIILGVLYIPWMINGIGYSNYAIYSIAITLISFFSIDFGLSEAVTRFISKYNSSDDYLGKNKFLSVTFRIYIVIDLLIFLVLGIVYLNISRIYANLTILEIKSLKTVFLIISMYTVASFPFIPLNGILISHHKYSFVKLMDILYKVLTTSLMILALFFFGGVITLVAINTLVGLMVIVIKIIYIKKTDLIIVDLKFWDNTIFREIIKFIAWMTIIAVSQRLIFNIMPSILGALANSDEIAKFAISSTIEGYTWMIAAALSGLFLPSITEMTHKSTDNKAIEKLMLSIGKYQLVILGLILLGFILVGKEFLFFWVGGFFDDSYLITVLLISPLVLVMPLQIAETTLTARGLLKYRAIGSLIVGVGSMVLSILLSKELGALGVGISIFTSSMIGYVFYMNIVYIKVLKFNMKKFFLNVYFKYIFVILCTLIVWFFISYFFQNSSIFALVIKILIISIIYCASVYYAYLNSDERKIIIKLFKKNTKGEIK